MHKVTRTENVLASQWQEGLWDAMHKADEMRLYAWGDMCGVIAWHVWEGTI